MHKATCGKRIILGVKKKLKGSTQTTYGTQQVLGTCLARMLFKIIHWGGVIQFTGNKQSRRNEGAY